MDHQPFTERTHVIFLVASVLLLALLLGAAAQLPLSVTLAAGAAIGCWLLLFAVRERKHRQRS